MTAEQRAAAGAEYLDRTRPGWYGAIDTKHLKIRSTCDCVLGQLNGNYCDSEEYKTHTFTWLHEHGFAVFPFYEKPLALTRAWRAEILKRREQEPSHAEA